MAGSWKTGLHPRDPAGRFTLVHGGKQRTVHVMSPIGRHTRQIGSSDRVSHSAGLAWANREQANKRAGVTGKRRKKG